MQIDTPPPLIPQSTVNTTQGKPDNSLIRRTFLLSEQADRSLIRQVALNKLNDKKPVSVSALLRLIIESHITLDNEAKQASYTKYNPLSFNITLSGNMDEIKTLDDYRQRRANKTNRTFTLLKYQLVAIERQAALNRYENTGPQTVNALLLHLVNEYLKSIDNI
ncbi:hypothetical protein [Scandinavium lactucae]|uniref:CopG family transcriptional regulator n=1 Tax=Scandinavium lactucae TaxID=3095028 RepID=A0ABU4QJ75_9ENTR|nr:MULTISPECIES: hypothetical protein [unclassified Scandinavium]MDX6039361.1 hypothetical protein [Scandinavium sp. V105_6]MDX6050432.1 hypothetical protein [Scandinavium sp. V105_1]